MSVMYINDVSLPDNRPLTVDDLNRLPEDGNRYELVYGVLEVTPAPMGKHEIVLTRLKYLLTYWSPAGLEIAGGQGINLNGDPTRHRIPDTSVIRKEDYTPEYQVRPAVLVIEVASPSTARRDRTVKKAEYEEFGIESY